VSPQESTEIKPSLLGKFNVYTVMLGLSFLAVGAAIALLSLELARYDWDIKAKTAPPMGMILGR